MGVEGGTGTDIYTLLYVKQINKNLLYSTGYSIQYCVMDYMLKESFRKKRGDICITDSLCNTPKTNLTL